MVIDCLLACCSSSAGGLAVRFISQGRCQVSVTPQTVVFIVFLIMRQARKSGFPDFRKISVRGFGRIGAFFRRISAARPRPPAGPSAHKTPVARTQRARGSIPPPSLFPLSEAPRRGELSRGADKSVSHTVKAVTLGRYKPRVTPSDFYVSHSMRDTRLALDRVAPCVQNHFASMTVSRVHDPHGSKSSSPSACILRGE